MNRIIRFRLMALVAVCLSVSAFAQDKTVKKIIETGKNDNQVMVHENHLANYIGGRPVGSSALTHAEAWVKEQFESWGLEVMVQEAGEINVGFDRGPWYGRMLSEDGFPLHFGTPAYTAPTRGKQVGHVMVEPKSRREFERMKGALKGAWVLLDAPSTGMAIDWSEKANQDRAEIIKQNEEIDRQNMEIRAYNMSHRDETPKEMLPYKQVTAPFYKEMVDAGVLGFIRSAAVPLRVMYDRANCYNITMENLPTVCDICLDEAQFKVIKEKVLRKDIFQLEFDIRNHFFRGPVKYHNIIGIIRGLLGSKFFVENKTVPLEKISNYFNRDGGPLMSTGITVPPAMYDDFVEVCKPIMDFNPEIPFTVTKRPGEPRPRPTSAGGSDHAYFAMNGVPTVGFQESDPLGKNFEYQEIWHTERDIYNKVIPEYMEHSATVTAVVVYGLANLDHQLSRQGLYKE